MQDITLNDGFLFGELTGLFQCACSPGKGERRVSASDSLLQTIRLINPRANSDWQLFRDYRNGNLDEESVIHAFKVLLPPDGFSQLSHHLKFMKAQYDEAPGCWISIDGAITGFQSHVKSSEEDTCLKFIRNLLQYEVNLILSTKELSSVEMASCMMQIAPQILPLNPQYDSLDIIHKRIAFLIGRSLFWIAIIDLFINSSSVNNSFPKGNFVGFLPRLNKKKQMIYGIELLLESLRDRAEFKRPGSNRVTWNDMYQIISLKYNQYQPHGAEFKDADAIAKHFYRVRKEGHNFTIKDYWKYFSPVLNNNECHFDTSLLVIPSLQVLDIVVRQLISEGIAEDFIIDEINRYSVFVKFVDKKLRKFIAGEECYPA